MKKIVVLLSLLIIITGCNYKLVKVDETQNNSNSNSGGDGELFQKKQECASYRDDIEKILNDDQEQWTRMGNIKANYLDQVFYSPSLNTCIYAVISGYRNSDGSSEDVFLIYDYLTAEVISSFGGGRTDQDRINDVRGRYNAEIEKLKK